MSDLSKLAGSTRPDVIPDYLISPLRLTEYGYAEDAFARWHLRSVTRGMKGAPEDQRDKAIALAEERIAQGYFGFGAPGFNAQATTAKGTLLIWWLSLRIKHGEMTYSDACKLANQHAHKTIPTVRDLLGMTTGKKKAPAAAIQTSPSPSTGPVSTPSSEPQSPEVAADSPSNKSTT